MLTKCRLKVEKNKQVDKLNEKNNKKIFKDKKERYLKNSFILN